MIICLSASYMDTSLSLLESVNIQAEDKLAEALCSEETTQECVLLQTCHRIEIYCVLQTTDKDVAVKRIMKLWSTETGVSSDIIAKVVRIYDEKEALIHLFYVVSGLESMVLGEDQILGQVRNAYLKAKELGTTGLILDKVFMKAINTGKRVRNETKVDEGSVSISSVAVDLAAKELGDLASAKTLIIGAGEAGRLAAEALKSHGAVSIIIANRSYDRGINLAKKVSGKAIRLSQIFETLPNVDLVIGAVSVEHPLLNEQQLFSALTANATQKKMMLIDVSQPRAFDEKIGLFSGVCLKTIDDLKEIVAENMLKRQAEAEKCKSIISEELARFETELSKIVAQPLITEICRRYEDIRQKELKRAINKLGACEEEKLVIIERFSRELVERIAQIPIEQLKKAALSSDGELLSAAERLFQKKS